MSASIDHAAPGQCENCGTALQGHYCHICGQRALNPLHSFSHALEEVFESLWHLDGRVFRTMRDLLVPGRVAASYLAGHRVRYIPPLRLFLILTVITFFFGHFAINIDKSSIQIDDNSESFDQAKTVAEVERKRAGLLRKLEQAKKEGGGDGLVASTAIDATYDLVNKKADARLRELGATPTPAPKLTPPAPAPSTKTAVATKATGAIESTSPAQPASSAEATKADSASNTEEKKPKFKVSFGDSSWDPRSEDANVPWLPAFVNRWLTKEGRRAASNSERVENDPQALVDAWLSAMPSGLFVLMPIFALLLKLFYAFSKRTYLEHLVVALYSHAWLMLAMFFVFVCSMLMNADGTATAVSVISGIVLTVLTLWMPLYLFLMQKRVYGQGWVLTTLKFFALGSIYFMMLSIALALSVMVGLVKM